MATIKPDSVVIPFTAGADLSAKQYYGVKLHTTEGQVVLAGATDEAIGVLDNSNAKSGYPVSVVVGGGAKAVASAVIAVNKKVNFDANGKLQEAVATKFFIGRTLEASTADGDVISIIIEKGFVPA
jgi:hypothetical protein